MRYDGRNLQVRITDTVTGASSQQGYVVDISGTIGSRTAHVGFTAATGLGTSAQDLLKWYYASPPLVAKRDAAATGKLIAARASKPGQTVAAWPVGPRPRIKAPLSLAAMASIHPTAR